MTIERQTNIPLTIVVAMAKNHIIGRDGALPWRLSDDLKWFKQVTFGKPVIMGRKTYQSIGKPLPGRDNIVISRCDDFQAPGVTVAATLEDAISIAEAFAISREVGEICVIGGGMIYEEALPLVNKIYLTEIDAEIKGDTTFPALAATEWSRDAAGQISKGEKNDHDASLNILTRQP